MNDDNNKKDKVPNYERTVRLFTNVINLWTQKQFPTDEIAGLHRIRADCYMNVGNAPLAQQDYTTAINYLQQVRSTSMASADDNNDDFDDEERVQFQQQIKDEMTIATLGRARATKGRVVQALASSSSSSSEDAPTTKSLVQQWIQNSITDYEHYLILTSREEWDTQQEYITDGIVRNPYAGWEYGTMIRLLGNTQDNNNNKNNNIMDTYKQAGRIHLVTSEAFANIGDKSRSVLSAMDAGIDYASAAAASSSSATTTTAPPTTNNNNKNNKKKNANAMDPDLLNQAEMILRKAIQDTPGITSRKANVELLRQVIVKEGESRMALASLLWSQPGDGKQQAELYLGDACLRLDQLQTQMDLENSQQAQQQQQQPKPPSKTRILTNPNAAAVGTMMTTTSSAAAAAISPTVPTTTTHTPVLYSIDDEMKRYSSSTTTTIPTCTRYKNKLFLTETIQWSVPLQELVIQLETLQ